jgi:hypothetical protein
VLTLRRQIEIAEEQEGFARLIFAGQQLNPGFGPDAVSG